MNAMNERPRGRDVVVIGASAGGVEAVSTLASKLPSDLPAAVFVVLHLPPEGKSVLPHILGRAGPLPAAHATDGDDVELGRILVAPPDHHLELEDGVVRLTRGPRENGHRPAVDRLFVTAAAAYGTRVTGVVLSGALDDGTLGLAEVARAGGAALVQEPSEALYPDMPTNAALYVQSARMLTIDEIASQIEELAATPHVPAELEVVMTQQDPDPDAITDAQPGRISGFTCPECGGTLWESEHEDVLSFRCRVGHAFTSESLASAQASALEAALWSAVRALEERSALGKRLARRFEERGRATTARRYERRAEEAREQADSIRAAIDALGDLEAVEGI